MGCSFNPHRVVTHYVLLMLVWNAENKESIRPVCYETEWAQIVVLSILFSAYGGIGLSKVDECAMLEMDCDH